ncbi:MAG: hypothetical protein JNL74_17350 [Fibrobacteres bacterium]|nr:hypothetical protein [Fibrobacterota bacterium]
MGAIICLLVNCQHVLFLHQNKKPPSKIFASIDPDSLSPQLLKKYKQAKASRDVLDVHVVKYLLDQSSKGEYIFNLPGLENYSVIIDSTELAEERTSWHGKVYHDTLTNEMVSDKRENGTLHIHKMINDQGVFCGFYGQLHIFGKRFYSIREHNGDTVIIIGVSSAVPEGVRNID